MQATGRRLMRVDRTQMAERMTLPWWNPTREMVRYQEYAANHKKEKADNSQCFHILFPNYDLARI
jgi:hypothetical protein